MFGPGRLAVIGIKYLLGARGCVYRVYIIVLPRPPLFAMRVSHRRHALRHRLFIVAPESLLTSPPKCCSQVRPRTHATTSSFFGGAACSPRLFSRAPRHRIPISAGPIPRKFETGNGGTPVRRKCKTIATPP